MKEATLIAAWPLRVKIPNLLLRLVLIVRMKSTSPKREADDVISQTGCALLPFAGCDSSSLLAIFFANGFPEEGSTWISQTICGKLQENWQQILGERTEGGRRVQARMCARVREEENEVESYKDPQGVLFSGALTVVPQGSPLSK